MRRIALVAAGCLVIVSLVIHPRAQIARGPVTTKIVPGYPSIITLDVPANDFSTFDAVRQILDGADAPYGLEGPVPTDRPPVDFAQRPERTLTLTGLTVGAALEAVVKANPHFRWSETDGLIVARLAPDGAGLLDRKLERYVLAGASPREALQTLLTALDPNRPAGLGISGMGRPAMGREGAPPTRVGKNVTLALEGPTVVAALNAVARADGAMSWLVQYDHVPADASSATITFTESGEMVTAVPLDVAREAPTVGAFSADLPVMGDVTNMVMNYARVSGVRLGIEQLPLAPLRPTRGLPPIRVANLTPAQVLTRIVAYDSRYEWAESKGVFYVRPKAGAGASPLDKTVDSFTAAGEPLDSVMRRIVSILSPGSQTGNSSSIAMSGSPIQQQMAAFRARPITIAVRGPATLRDVIDAVTGAVGPATWMLRANSASQNSTFFDLSLQMVDQPLMVSWPFTTPSAVSSAGPVPASVSALPPAIAKRQIERTFMSPDVQPSAFARLGTTAGVAMGVEMLPPPAQGADPRMQAAPQPGLTLGPGSFGDALATLLERLPEYEIANASGVVSVAPRELVRAPTHFMNVRIGRFEIKDVPIRAAIVQLRQRLNPNYPGMTGPGAAVPGGRSSAPPPALMYGEKPLTLSLENPTPREVLNALVAQQGDVSWTVTYESSVTWVPAQAREADCAITLTAFPSGGLNARFPRYVDPAAPPPPPRPDSLPSSSVVGPRLTIDLPLTPRTLRISLQRVFQTTRTPIGIEVVTPYEPGPTARPPVRTHTYDLTGLTVEQALDKIVGFMPDYAWQKDGGVYHVRPKALASSGSLPFDRRVDSFAQQFPDIRSAMYGVLALLNPARAAAPTINVVGGVVGGISGGNPVADRNAQYTNRPIAVDLKGATIREILDAMILKHGDMWWSANYTDANGTYPQVTIEFVGFDGWIFGSGTPIR